MFAWNKIKQGKGLIYIHDYNIPDIYGYYSNLKKEYNLSDVQKSNMDKKQKNYFHSNPTDFEGKKIYYERPMSCKKFLKYAVKQMPWNNTNAMHARCSNEDHNKNKCTSTEVKCYHCEAGHQAFSRFCPKIKIETEIIQVQTKERIPRLHGTRKFLGLNPNPELMFSKAVRNTSNQIISKSPTISEQEKSIRHK